MSILIFLGVIFVLILVHELGHYAVAKWTGMRVDEFGIGFPPKLFGIKKGETEYTFNLFPIGGFVKIFGEDGITDTENRTPDGEVKDSRSFTSRNKWAQSAVLVAGVVMNVLFAWLLVAIVYGIGIQTGVTEEAASADAQLRIAYVAPDSPAAQAGLVEGSRIMSMQADGVTLENLVPSAFSAFIQTYSEATHTIAFLNDGELQVAVVTPQAGVVEASPEQVAIGVELALVDTVKYGFFSAVYHSFLFVVTGLRDITIGISTLLYDAVMFRADLSSVAGPVGIVSLVGEASAYGVTTLLLFTAFISLNLAVINIMPFPALDGGRLLFVAIEAIKGSPIRPQFTAVLNTIGFLLLILLMVAITWNDITRFF